MLPWAAHSCLRGPIAAKSRLNKVTYIKEKNKKTMLKKEKNAHPALVSTITIHHTRKQYSEIEKDNERVPAE